jgi:uncharacterized protein YgfB (UPF0149 family)
MPKAPASNFDGLGERLALLSELAPTVSEAHGMLCGLLCAHAPDAEHVWVEELLRGSDPQDLNAAELGDELRRLGEGTREEIEGPGLGFSPLLPPEDRPLRERAVGLYDWSRGFLYGLGLAGVDASQLSEQTREALDDLADVTRLDLDSLDEGEDNEEALVELVEFVWVAAMLIYEECTPDASEPS